MKTHMPRKGHSPIATAAIAVAAFMAGNALTGSATDSSQRELPAIGPITSSGCTSEAAAYAQALLDIESAQEAAGEAYDEWYACENGGSSKTEPNPISAEYSVLEK